MSATSLHETIRNIESTSRRDPGERGLAAHAERDRLLPAARELMDGERIIIVTGFCIRAAMIGETDGPPGALAVADAPDSPDALQNEVMRRRAAWLLEQAPDLF